MCLRVEEVENRQDFYFLLSWTYDDRRLGCSDTQCTLLPALGVEANRRQLIVGIRERHGSLYSISSCWRKRPLSVIQRTKLPSLRSTLINEAGGAVSDRKRRSSAKCVDYAVDGDVLMQIGMTTTRSIPSVHPLYVTINYRGQETELPYTSSATRATTAGDVTLRQSDLCPHDKRPTLRHITLIPSRGCTSTPDNHRQVSTHAVMASRHSFQQPTYRVN